MGEDVSNDHDLLVLIAERTRVIGEQTNNHAMRIASLEQDRDRYLQSMLSRLSALETTDDAFVTQITALKQSQDSANERNKGRLDVTKMMIEIIPVIAAIAGIWGVQKI